MTNDETIEAMVKEMENLPFISHCTTPEDYAQAAYDVVKIMEINPLVSAAQAVIDRWDSPNWKDLPHTAEYIYRLRMAIAQYEQEEGESQ